MFLSDDLSTQIGTFALLPQIVRDIPAGDLTRELARIHESGAAASRASASNTV
jgi:hypothetical protein